MLIPGFWRYCKGFQLTPQQVKAIDWLLWAILIQFGLGVLTLIMVVPVWLGVLHQGGAVILLMTAVYIRFLLNSVESA
jgi:cytochrome c oxidase assembly protein subunit 15